MTTTTSEPRQGALRLADAAFHGEPVLDFDHRVELLTGTPGLLLDGPKQVMVDQETIPYLGVRITTLSENRRVDLRQYGALVATRLDDGACSAAFAFRGGGPGTEPLPQRPAAPPEDDDPIMDLFPLSLTDRVRGLEWGPGVIRAWVVLYDQRSNPVTTEVVKQKIADPEVAKFLEQLRTPAYAEQPSPPPGDPLPSYGRPEGAPPVPEQVGVALALPRVTLGGEGAELVVRGSFRVPLRRRELVRPLTPEEEAARERAFADRGLTPPRRATAVVQLALMLFGDTDPGPRVVRLFAPTWDPVDPERLDGAIVTGHFALDLCRETGLRYETYAVWALGGGELTGPTLAAIVDPAMVPRPGE